MQNNMGTEIDVRLETRLLDARAFSDILQNMNEAVADSRKNTSDLMKISLYAKTNVELQDEKVKLEKRIAELENERDAAIKLHNVFLPDAALAVFGLTRMDLPKPETKPLFPALRAWCGFVEWSASNNVENADFVRQFQKVDAELALLRGNQRLSTIRQNIQKNVWDVIDRNLRAEYKVSWPNVGDPFNTEKHINKTPSGGGIILFVECALITLDGALKQKASVETETGSQPSPPPAKSSDYVGSSQGRRVGGGDAI